MEITRESARAIVRATIEELEKVEDDHPRIAEVLENVKNMLTHVIALDAMVGDSNAVGYFGGMLKNAWEMLGGPEVQKLSPEHEQIIIETRRVIQQFTCQILGIPFSCDTRVLKRSDFTAEQLSRPWRGAI
jgi:hypothetical protein